MFNNIDDFYTACKNCSKCSLRKLATQVVPGEGNPHADIMFIGEGPGATEDKLGRPFVGSAGKFLDTLLKSVGFNREDVYIANMVKCRPPENRDPLDSEKDACKEWLDEQIALIKPKVFVPLGKHALHKFLPTISISSAHGKLFKTEMGVVFAMYHPAVALYKGSMRQTLLADIQNLKKYLEGQIEATNIEKKQLLSDEKVAWVKDLMDKKHKDEDKQKEDTQQISLF